MSGEQEIVTKEFLTIEGFNDIYTYRKRCSKVEFFMTLMKLMFDFLFTDLSQHYRIYLVIFALKFFIYGHK